MKKIVLENEIGIVSKDYDLNKFAEQLSKISKKKFLGIKKMFIKLHLNFLVISLIKEF